MLGGGLFILENTCFFMEDEQRQLLEILDGDAPQQDDLIGFDKSDVITIFLDDSIIERSDFRDNVIFLDDKEAKISFIDKKEKHRILMNYDNVVEWWFMMQPQTKETFKEYFYLKQKRSRANLKLNSSIGGAFMKALKTSINLRGSSNGEPDQLQNESLYNKFKGKFKL